MSLTHIVVAPDDDALFETTNSSSIVIEPVNVLYAEYHIWKLTVERYEQYFIVQGARRRRLNDYINSLIYLWRDLFDKVEDTSQAYEQEIFTTTSDDSFLKLMNSLNEMPVGGINIQFLSHFNVYPDRNATQYLVKWLQERENRAIVHPCMLLRYATTYLVVDTTCDWQVLKSYSQEHLLNGNRLLKTSATARTADAIVLKGAKVLDGETGALIEDTTIVYKNGLASGWWQSPVITYIDAEGVLRMVLHRGVDVFVSGIAEFSLQSLCPLENVEILGVSAKIASPVHNSNPVAHHNNIVAAINVSNNRQLRQWYLSRALCGRITASHHNCLNACYFLTQTEGIITKGPTEALRITGYGQTGTRFFTVHDTLYIATGYYSTWALRCTEWKESRARFCWEEVPYGPRFAVEIRGNLFVG
eukprot:NODE_62_length_25126_cov_0.447277.p5 type:complete len:417 gc:universal NODE_62_length_25126_cov_0.447277:24727-23477(-)